MTATFELAARSAGLRRSLPEGVRTALAYLVRSKVNAELPVFAADMAARAVDAEFLQDTLVRERSARSKYGRQQPHKQLPQREHAQSIATRENEHFGILIISLPAVPHP